MKAYVLHGIGEFQYEEIGTPKIEPGTVLVQVKAAGICGSDIPRIYRTGAYHHPMTPGHEFAGQVIALGSGVDEKWLNKRVGVFPLIPCMECSQCKRQEYEMCQHYNYLGSRTDGGFAEYVRVPEWNLLELSDKVTYQQAAMLEPMAVAVHAIRRGGITATDTVAVCGLGTIGLFVTMFLLEMGCRKVYVAGNKAFQRDMAETMGILPENFCDIRVNDWNQWIAAKTENQGVDVFLDCVGKNEVLSQGILSLGAKGRLITVGNPAGDIALPKEVYWRILRKQLQISGTWNSSFTHDAQDDWHYVLECLEQGRIAPEKVITHIYPLERFREGFEIMRDKTEDYVKIMTDFS